ncbi:bifunctional 2-methylcitrate synthase/citrate synthase [Parvularcula sp. LCG005]|uniref:bifunctional 2-methylcitrate synthase/citrate synthase n=1 Tax=Parvularcula sp. LCG005 TaxID=3078805 RepID=UPI0029430A5C|nr:bifunctional 2-methylcitrate synthase/citrate synthase [Parvularcula sp. LCG005]WOI54566.1 bifunctional 2-methylcitrate synthase/citrate synthase [Parvularcula sp. LCG005]
MSDTEIRYGLQGVVADDTAISKVMPESNSLTYRGYPVQDLAVQCRFEEVAYLIWNGELPTASQLAAFERAEIAARGAGDEVLSVLSMMSRDAHPMDTLRTAVSFLGQADPQAEDATPEALMDKSISLYAKIPELIAADFRRRQGKKPIAPTSELGFCENFFHMCFGSVPKPEIVKCFDISMTLYAEHSFNASTFTARTITSSMSDIYSAVTGAIGSLKGPLHGGANEAVMHMLREVGSAEKAEAWMLDALATKKKIMGFGHRVYRSGDSRVPTMTAALERIVAVIDTKEAQDLWAMSRVLDDTMVREKGIYPNLDFPAGPAYYLMGFAIPMFTPIFVMSRITGWTAHIMEQWSRNRLIRPLSNYDGPAERAVTPLATR